MDKNGKIKDMVKDGYSRIVTQNTSCCPQSSCCGISSADPEEYSKNIGYEARELAIIPQEANLGLGCGNPTALGALKEGETVLDLGSGAGMDSFLAARKVGPAGKVIGVDMTPEMVSKAKENALKNGFKNVEFILGEIEQLPLSDASVDVILSNCVINLSPEKEKVFQEAFRVLKPGGRLMVSDVVLLNELPENMKKSVEAYVGCVAGAEKKEEYLSYIKNAGFEQINVLGENSFFSGMQFDETFVNGLIEGNNLTSAEIKETIESVVSMKFSAQKPKE